MRNNEWDEITKLIGCGYKFVEYSEMEYLIYNRNTGNGMYAPINLTQGYVNGFDISQIKFKRKLQDYSSEINSVLGLSENIAVKVIQERIQFLSNLKSTLIAPELFQEENPYILIKKITTIIPGYGEFDDSIYDPKVNYIKSKFYRKYYEFITNLIDINTKFLKTYYNTDTGNYKLFINSNYNHFEDVVIKKIYDKLIEGEFIHEATSYERFEKLFVGGSRESKMKWKSEHSKFASLKSEISNICDGDISDFNKVLSEHFVFFNKEQKTYKEETNTAIGKIKPSKNYRFKF